MTNSNPVDPTGFREFEHAGWERAVHHYHDSFGGLTTQAVGPLLDRVAARRGVRLLDIGTGPGYVAAAAAKRGASAVGLDFSAAMVVEARRRYAAVEFQEGDAEDLSFADGGFDAVVTNFGLLHFPRPEKALQEAHRVLCSGGRMGFTVWAKPDVAVAFGMVLGAIESYGELNVALPPGPPFFRFSEPEECRRVLLEVGFVRPRIEQVPQVWRLHSADSVFESFFGGTVRTAGLLRAQSREALNSIRAAVRKTAETYRRSGLIEIPMPAVLASAVKT